MTYKYRKNRNLKKNSNYKSDIEIPCILYSLKIKTPKICSYLKTLTEEKKGGELVENQKNYPFEKEIRLQSEK